MAAFPEADRRLVFGSYLYPERVRLLSAEGVTVSCSCILPEHASRNTYLGGCLSTDICLDIIMDALWDVVASIF
jgi:hypothetical protein